MSVEALSRQITRSILRVRRGENVWIHSWDHTLHLASAIAFDCQKHGAQSMITVETEEHWIRSLQELPKSFLETVPPYAIESLEETHAFIFLLGPRNPIDWTRIPSEKRELADVWYLGSGKYAETWRSLARKHRVRMLGIEYCLVTPERARALGLNGRQWRSMMLAGCLVDQHEISKRAKKLAELLRTGEKVVLKTSSGTDLCFRLVGREPNVGDSILSEEDADKGIVKFVPSGFVETAPDENSADGTVVFDFPIPLRDGRRIEDLRLKFAGGRVVDYSARSGVDLFRRYIESGTGDIDRFAFFGLGLNPGLKHGFTQDDKALGGTTVGIGGNADKHGKNRTSNNNHWWASVTQATVRVDQTRVLEKGSFVFR